MSIHTIEEIPDSDKVFHDTVFVEANKHLANQWIRIAELYPGGIHQPLLPSELSREQFGQGNHYECFMLTALSTLVRFPRIIQNCFVSKNPRRDGRYTFQFFRGKEWVKVEIDDYIPLEDGEELYIRSPTEHWWPLLLEKAYAKFYTGYENLEGCTLQEAYHDLTGNPVLNIPIDSKLAKAAGADVTEGHYWLDLAQNIQSGQFVASVLTKDMELESMGLQREQQYGILEIFSMTGTSSVNDIVVHLHNPFEDDELHCTGPLNSKDLQWTPKLRAKYNVDDEHSIFLPLNTFLKIINSMQLCYISPVESDATYFDDEWKGESAGGNPTSATWRKNPLYCVQNTGNHAVRLVVMIKQEDQRRFTSLEENAQYLQCGVVLIQNSYGNQIPTYFVTGNNYKPIHKSLFLNSREVANTITIPPNSLCYLVPSCMSKGAEGKFTLALYRMVGEDYSSLLIKKLSIPEMDWAHPAVEQVNLEQKQKDRVDFYVDQETDIHILMHQLKPYVSPKTGGDAMAQDYMGMYLYDDTDRKIAGVHAATNFREIGIVFHLPRSGRYALSVTCPRGKGQVPALITIVGSSPANARVVESPEDAGMFDDDDIIDEGDDATAVSNPIDYTPIRIPVTKFTELPDSNTPFEDKRFMVDNKAVTNDPWIHIGDLYPEGKTQPLLPDRLSRDQFEQGEHFECCCLTAFASLVDRHPDVIRNVFVTKQVRRDGRYTFQFHRYGQWVKVEIDDRIPLTEQQTLFCRSPTRHWWPLLLEKACAKFYTLYQNLEGCSLQELYYDFTGQPVMSIPTDLKLAKSAMYPIDDPDFWTELNDDLKSSALGAFTSMEEAEAVGMQGNQTYGILAILSTKNDANVKLSDLLVMIYNPFVEATYTGPMNSGDSQWTPELRSIFAPERSNVIYMPVPVFCDVFVSMHQVHIKGLLSPSWHFNSEWGEGTNGGNPTLVTWRENPLYLVRNPSDEPLQIMAMIGQPDQRHRLHLLPEQELNYIQCGLVLSQCTSSNPLPTYLVTGNNHRIVNKGLFVDSRESANRVTIPPKSLCYLVPNAMFRDKGKFLLSYWYQKEADGKQMKLVRLKVDAARHLPAIEHLELRKREKDRVDFLVDVPTDIHILLRQEKPFKSSNGGDAMAEDFLGMYLYDGNDKRIQGVTSATNYREMGIVHHLPDPGRYALCITCPRGHGTVPCKVEVVGVEAAHVRITDPPEGAGELGEIDLDFLDLEPEGVPLDDLALDGDEIIQGLLADLKELHKDFDNNGDAIAALEHQVNDRAHAMAKKVIGKDRPKYLPGHDLNVLNPLLDSNRDYMSTEHERFVRKKDPRNGAKVQIIEEVLQRKANDIAQQLNEPDFSVLDPAPEGIPIQDIPLMGDAAFSAMARERMKLKRDPTANASKINDLEEKMNDLAHELANQMHARERTFLDPEPEGVPLELLSLNDNATLSKLECDLRALNRKPRKDAKAIAATEDKISDHVYALARELKNNERDIFLDPQPEGVPVADLHLDSDEAFHAMEVERLFLRKEDPQGNMNKIKDLENAMNDRARELARAQVSKNRGFLDPEPFGFPLEELGLEFDDAVAAEEAKLRELKRDPKRNAAGIKATEGAIANLVDGIARKKAELDRAFLDPEPEGRLVWELPLNDDKPFVGMDTKRRQLLRRGEDPAKVKALEDAMNDGAHEMARALNAKERPDYLSTSSCGIPLEDLPLDSDPEFRELEAKRQQLKRDPMRKAVLAEVEAALNARAEELAKRQLANDRGYLNPTPDGVPVYLLPLDDDPPFQALEAKRAQLKKNPRRNAKAIHDMEDDLNDRALELATELKASERKKFLNPKPNGIPIADVPINNDGLFRDMEIQRLILREDPVRNATAISNLEDALNERALELAAKMLADERAFLDPEPLGIPLVELPLDDNERFLEMEAKLRELRKKGNREDPTIAGLERDLNDVVRQISAEVLEKDRDFLDPEPEGRLLEDLPLRNDKEFHGLEKNRFYLKKDPKKNSQKLADIEELMNERAHQIAKALNASERKNYLDHFPKGVPLEDLPLDTDGEFSKLEAKLAQLMRNPRKHKAAIKDLQDALNLRAEELAQEKLQDERSFMDPEPEGIPLKYLPLDEDSIFHEKEIERLTLKAENSRKNDERLKTLEGEMMDRANKLAVEMKLKGRDAVLDKAPKGVPLDILPLDDDMPFADLEVEYLKVLGDGEDPSKTQNLADAMRKRAEDMANKVKADSRMNLEQNPLGIPLEELPLEKNKDFDAQERELFVLKRDPRRNADAIRDAIDKLNALVFEMAKECVGLQRDFLDPEPEGRYLSELPLNTDPTFLGLEKQRRELKKDPYANEDRVADLEQMMNDRAHELAKKMNAMERPSYMEPAYHGVPASALPLDGDKEFGNLEAERARLCHEPGKNSSQIAKVEAALNQRAEGMAAEALRQDRMFLGEEVEGVPVRHLPLNDDAEFSRLEAKRATLKNSDPVRNMKAIRDLEEQMMDRAVDLANELKGDLRSLLDQRPLGVPLESLPLDDDGCFFDLEENYRELSADSANRGKLDDILDQLNERARELAQDLHDKERSVLEQRPEGVPLSALPLNTDKEFNALETEARTLRNIPSGRGKNAARLKELEDAMNRRAVELANESRKAFCDATPEGIPLELLKLGDMDEFTRLEEELRELRKDPGANKEAISDLEYDLNNKAHEAAREIMEGDRGYLDPKPCGVSLSVLPIGSDPTFHALEVERGKLKAANTHGNTRQIKDLEEKLNDRLRALAEEQKAEDLSGLDEEPEGVPLSELKLHDDDVFDNMVGAIRDLKRNPNKNSDLIDDLRGRMNDRAHELAQEKLRTDRAFLDKNPQGVPLEILPLSTDPQFRRLEAERAKLKAQDPRRNAKNIRDLEDALNNRSHELARDQLREDLTGVNDMPRDIPLEALQPHSDPAFAELVNEIRALKADPNANANEIERVLHAMNNRVDELAAAQLDRDFLDPNPEGVPLEILPLDTDPGFHAMETERAKLKLSDPRRNAKKIKDLEDDMSARAHELAKEQLAEDLRGLDSEPCGIPIELLQPHNDSKFHGMVKDLRKLKSDPSTNTDKIAGLIDEMNERAGELAKDVLQSCREVLDPCPEGLPLNSLPLDEDKPFQQIEIEMAKLKLTNPVKNAGRIDNLVGQLNDRASEIARAMKARDLEGLEQTPCGIPLALLKPHDDSIFASLANEARTGGSKSRSISLLGESDALNKRAKEIADQHLSGDRGYLDRDPEGIPLSALPLDTDPEFNAMEVERAVLKLSNPKKNADKIKSLEGRLNDRAHELARERLSGDRGFLDAEPEGVPLADLPLDDDLKFHQMEVERANLKERDPVCNANAIKDLEDDMNARAHELAKKILQEDLEGVDTMPEGVPLLLLQPHKDAEFLSFLPDLRRLKKDPKRNATAISGLQDKMNDRVHELARDMIAEGRKSLDPEPEGVPLELLPLDSDKKFSGMEKELYALQVAPRRDDAELANLRGRLNDRAHELAKEKIQGDRGFLNAEQEGVPLADLPLDDDLKFNQMERQRAKLKDDPVKNASSISRLEDELNDRARELAKELKKAERSFLNARSYGIPKELLPLDRDRNFLGMEQQLRRLKQNPHRNAVAIQNLRDMMQDRADELGLQMLKGDRPQYLDPEYEGVEIVDIPIDDDSVFTELELERAILKGQDPVLNKGKIGELEGKLGERAKEMAKERINRDRMMLNAEPEGIPLGDLPLDDDTEFKRREGQLRKLCRDMRRNGPAISDVQDRLNDRAHELARDVVADDLKCLRDAYRGIPKEGLNLHKDKRFKELANRRRTVLSKDTQAANVSAIERAMDARACEIADDVVDNERAFLDRTPEGMDLADVPLDNDDRFATMEAERRKLSRDPRSTKRNRDIIRDLECDMNERAHELALEEFGKMRGFMDQEPEGVPLKEIPLNMDADFRNAEVERYRIRKGENKSSKELAKLEKVMNDRAHELAKAILARDRGFLDPEPEGVPLEELPLNTDEEFNKLAGKRRRLMGGSKKSRNPEVKDVEGKMNDRAHELANEYLQRLRGFLDPEPEGVPLEDVPLNRDPAFLDMERELIKIRKDPNASPHRMKDLEEDMNARARELAKDLVRKERAYLDPEPYGVLLADLPLNNDAVLKPLERQRRLLKKDPKRNGVAIRGCEEEIQDRVREIAKDFVEKERAFLDPQPEGVLLKYLPLHTDKNFRKMLLKRRKILGNEFGGRDDATVKELEVGLNKRSHELAKEMVLKNLSLVDPEPLGVPLHDIPFENDENFRKINERLFELAANAPVNGAPVKDLGGKLNDRLFELAEVLLDEERSFLDAFPFGIPLKELPLNNDLALREMERVRRRKLKKNLEDAEVKKKVSDRVEEIARNVLSSDRAYLMPNDWGIPLEYLPLNTDNDFHSLELRRRELKKDPKKNADAIRDIEDKLNDRALELAIEFNKEERAFLDQQPEGVPLHLLIDSDSTFHEMERERRHLRRSPDKNMNRIAELEKKMIDHVRFVAIVYRGWQDEEFHEANKDMAQLWPRIAELYPEGMYLPLEPFRLSSGDVASAPSNTGYIAPFIAALGRLPPLISQLMHTKHHPVNGPYSFTFFDPNSNPVRVDIDDRVPVDGSMEPKFTRVPQRSWYPLLLEKAYAKFIGGYSKLDQCTPHETLRDLTGRPVLHIPFDRKLAEAANTGDFWTMRFWEGVAHDLRRGDVITCMSNVECEDGIHFLCSYALLGVILTVEESNDPADVVIKLHNCYFDEPTYDGPLHRDDPSWTNDLRYVCNFDYSREEHLFLPLPTFLKNFSSMQRCHINCGDRLSSPGEWNEHTAGGNPKYTTFRTNPIYLVENKSSRPVTIIAELRHESPAFTDKDGLNHYHQTGLVLMQSVQAKIPPTPLITNSTHRFIQRGMMLDAREVCSQMELPPNTTCYLIPYTMKRGCHGKFHVSVYPDMAKVTLTPLRNAGLNHIPLSMNVDVPSNNEGKRVDILLNEPCDVHVLVRQTHVSDPSAIKKSDVVAEDDIAMHVYNEFGIKVGSTVSASNAREQALIFRASQGGRYSVILVCASKPLSGTCPCTLFIYVTKKASAEFVPVPSDAKPLGQSVRFPIIPRSAPNPYRTSSRERAYSRDRSVRRIDSLPPLQGAVRGSRGSQVSGMQPRRPSKGHVHSRESV